MARLKSILPKIGLSLLSIVVFLFLFELGLRFYVSKQPPIPFVPADSEVYKLSPNYEGVFAEAPVKINGQGFRQNDDVALNKQPNTIRIVGLGDSIAFGYGLEENKIYLRRLEGMLNKSSSQKYEVVNVAVSGYNTFQERKRLEEDVLKFQPDIIVLGFVLNDIAGDFHVPNMVYRTLAPFKSGAYSPDDLSSLEKFFYSLFRKTYVYQFLHPKLSIFWGFENVSKNLVGDYGKDTLSFYAKGRYPQKKYINSVKQVEKELLNINELAKKNNTSLVMLIFPAQIQLEDKNLRKPQELILDFCQEKSMKCLDLIPFLEKEKEKVFLDLGHPNAYSSEIIAKTLYEYLIKNNIISL